MGPTLVSCHPTPPPPFLDIPTGCYFPLPPPHNLPSPFHHPFRCSVGRPPHPHHRHRHHHTDTTTAVDPTACLPATTTGTAQVPFWTHWATFHSPFWLVHYQLVVCYSHLVCVGATKPSQPATRVMQAVYHQVLPAVGGPPAFRPGRPLYSYLRHFWCGCLVCWSYPSLLDTTTTPCHGPATPHHHPQHTPPPPFPNYHSGGCLWLSKQTM